MGKLALLAFCFGGLIGPIPSSMAGTTGLVESVSFKTRVTPPVYRVPDELGQSELLFRAALSSLPEGTLVTAALAMGAEQLASNTNAVSSFSNLLADTYAKIGADPSFKNVTSALPYCFSTERPKFGHYFQYRPRKLLADSDAIVFLHGAGGNFLFFTWALKEAFPQHLILVPSWGATWDNGDARYIEDMLADVQVRLGVRPRRLWLMAISDSGNHGFTLYQQQRTRFSGYVCLASTIDARQLPAAPQALRVLMINGTNDNQFRIEDVRRDVAALKKKLPSLTNKEIAGDHFFLLSRRNETFALIRAFMDKPVQAGR